MSSDATLRVKVEPDLTALAEALLPLRDLGQALVQAGQAMVRLSELLIPPEGETEDSMAVHFEPDRPPMRSDAQYCPREEPHPSHTWAPIFHGLRVPCPGVLPGT